MNRAPASWYSTRPNPVLALLSLPFAAVAAARRALYAAGILASVRLPVPVVVVGNIAVGGTGKTPLVLWLARALLDAGRRPGIVSRGYGGSAAGAVEVVAASEAARVGDEPLLLARRSGVPVVVGRDRVAAARLLLARHPDRDVVISDDGLQHYRLARDFEIAVVDAARGFGNGCLLPAGPLRESVRRLAAADAIVIHGEGEPRSLDAAAARVPRYRMCLEVTGLHRVRDGAAAGTLASFVGRTWHAVAGIGHPARFFTLLRQASLDIVEHPFADHHAYVESDFRFDRPGGILMTEKDAVKCEAFVGDDAFSVEVSARIDPDLAGRVLVRLER